MLPVRISSCLGLDGDHPLYSMGRLLMTNWYFLIFLEVGFDMSVCMKCQILFSGKNRKNISKCKLKSLPGTQSIKNISEG